MLIGVCGFACGRDTLDTGVDDHARRDVRGPWATHSCAKRSGVEMLFFGFLYEIQYHELGELGIHTQNAAL